MIAMAAGEGDDSSSSRRRGGLLQRKDGANKEQRRQQQFDDHGIGDEQHLGSPFRSRVNLIRDNDMAASGLSI
ncbi:hypothetical protein Dimus_027180 [Dionaea muscipula]